MNYYKIENTVIALNTFSKEYWYAIIEKDERIVSGGCGIEQIESMLNNKNRIEITEMQFQRQFAKAVDHLANETPFY